MSPLHCGPNYSRKSDHVTEIESVPVVCCVLGTSTSDLCSGFGTKLTLDQTGLCLCCSPVLFFFCHHQYLRNKREGGIYDAVRRIVVRKVCLICLVKCSGSMKFSSDSGQLSFEVFHLEGDLLCEFVEIQWKGLHGAVALSLENRTSEFVQLVFRRS